MSMTQFVSLFQAAIVFGTVILYGAMGEILTEKSGNLNLGVPGIMYLGGIAGLAARYTAPRSPASVPLPSVIFRWAICCSATGSWPIWPLR